MLDGDVAYRPWSVTARRPRVRWTAGMARPMAAEWWTGASVRA